MTLYELGKEYLKQSDDLHLLVCEYSAQAKKLGGIRLYEMNTKITCLKEMERDTRIIGRQLTEYYSQADKRKAYRKHQFN